MENELWMLVYNEDYLIVLEYIMLYKKFIFIFLFFIKKIYDDVKFKCALL